MAEAQSIVPGDEVLAIEGTPVAELGPVRAELSLRGSVGESRAIEFGNGTRILPVEELLPTP